MIKPYRTVRESNFSRTRKKQSNFNDNVEQYDALEPGRSSNAKKKKKFNLSILSYNNFIKYGLENTKQFFFQFFSFTMLTFQGHTEVEFSCEPK